MSQRCGASVPPWPVTDACLIFLIIIIIIYLITIFSFSWSSSSTSSFFSSFLDHHHQHHHSSHLFLIIIINILNMISLIFCHFLLRLSSPSLPPHWSLPHEKSWLALIFIILLILVFSVIIIISTTHLPMNNHNWRHWMSSLADQEGSQRQSNCW